MSQLAAPLRGLRIAVTRPHETSGGLVEALAARGAIVLEHPAIRIADPADPAPLAAAAANVSAYDWILFTSANGVDRFAHALHVAGRSPLDAGRVACVGPATAAAARDAGFPEGPVAARHLSEGLVETLKAAGSLHGRRVLLPRSEAGRDVLPDALRALGADVDDVPAYRPVPDRDSLGALAAAVEEGGVDVVAFASSSAASAYAEVVGPGRVLFACIGPVTAETARSAGLTPVLVADAHTGAGLVEALEAWRAGKAVR
ncbi:MAG TPA: uroporphyrinogen-III synthase [Longimicrobiales bacterium]|nr:uroporphyrinogen-III synthase [Longimicrobiales bacterium]